jgi:hypothetical protein
LLVSDNGGLGLLTNQVRVLRYIPRDPEPAMAADRAEVVEEKRLALSRPRPVGSPAPPGRSGVGPRRARVCFLRPRRVGLIRDMPGEGVRRPALGTSAMAASLLRRSRRRPRTSWDGWRWLHETPFEPAVQARTLLPAVGGELVGFAQRIQVQGRSECAVPDLSALVRGIR